MANHKSSEKMIRKIEKRTAANKRNVSRIRTFIVKVEQAIAQGKKSEAEAALKAAQPEIMSGVTKNLLKLNAASRKVSRLAQRIKKLAA